MVVLGATFVVLTIILVLFSTQDVTRRQRLQDYHDLMFRQKMRFELAQMALGSSAPVAPAWLKAEVKKEVDKSLFLGGLFAAKPFSELPNLSQPIDLGANSRAQGYPGQRYLRYGLPNGEKRRVVVSESLGFAAVSLAAGSEDDPSLSFTSIKPWLNPTWGATSPDTLYSGSPPNLLATGDVEIDDYPYGFLYQSGPTGDRVSLGGGNSSAAVAFSSDEHFKGVTGLDPTAFRNTVRAQISTAFDSYRKAVSGADRTLLINQEVSIGNSLGMFFSQLAAPQSLQDRLSIRGSQDYWLPTVPALKRQSAKAVIWHFILNVPASPDGGLDEVSKKARSVISMLLDLIAELEKAKQRLRDAQDDLAEALRRLASLCSCKARQAWCCAPYLAAKAAVLVAKGLVLAAEAFLDQVETAIIALVSPLTAAMEAVLAAKGQVPPPTTRNEEKNFQSANEVQLDETGMEAWAYRAIFNNIASVASDLFSAQFRKIGRDFGNSVTVVFFGQPDKAQYFNFDNGFSTKSTWNVPPGRTFYYDGSMEIQGDLWVGRGGCFVVNGDLTMNPGDAPTGGGRIPSGTVYLEEGATLVVQGTFQGAGESGRGSVVVGGPLGAVHAISSALLVQGDATLPHGVVPGVGLDRLKTVSDGKLTGTTAPISSFFATLVNDVGPNLAKVDGPFHQRFPYIAKYATTFEWIEDLQLPVVMPMNFPNFHVMVFRGLSMLYAPTLNFELGENLMTHTDWWGAKGEGRVPILTKPEAVEFAQGSTAETSPSLGVTSASLAQAITKRNKQVGGDEVRRFANKLISQLALQWAQAIDTSKSKGLRALVTMVKATLTKIGKDYDLDRRETDLLNAVPAGVATLAAGMDGVWRAVETAEASASNTASNQAQECSGALIYSGGTLTVGSSSAGTRTPLSAGLFLAEGPVRLESKITVGSAISLEHGVTGQNLLYYPPFTQASLYLPQSEPGDWKDRALVTNYGSAATDTRAAAAAALPVGLWRPRLITELRGSN